MTMMLSFGVAAHAVWNDVSTSVNPLMYTLKPLNNGPQQYGDRYTGRWWVGCYIWYSEEGPGRAAVPPVISLYQM